MSLDSAPPSQPAGHGDYESGVGSGDELELRVRLRLPTRANLIGQAVRQGPHRDFRTTPPRFDALAQLHRAGKPLSMGELSRRLMVTNGNITGLVDRLVGEGKVRRLPSAEDRRIQMVSPTGEGAAPFADMARDNRRWANEAMDGLDREELPALFALLGRLKASIRDGERDTERTT